MAYEEPARTMRETPKAAASYAEYAAMGPTRSLAKLADMLSQNNTKPAPPLRTLKEWSSVHNWQERVRAHDAALIAEKEARRLADIEKMNDRQAWIGTLQQTRALEEIERILHAGEFTAQTAIRLLKLAVDIERTARGAPTAVERIEQTGKDGHPIEIIADARAILAARLAAQAEHGQMRR